jgi:hypothetical protein
MRHPVFALTALVGSLLTVAVPAFAQATVDVARREITFGGALNCAVLRYQGKVYWGRDGSLYEDPPNALDGSPMNVGHVDADVPIIPATTFSASINKLGAFVVQVGSQVTSFGSPSQSSPPFDSVLTQCHLHGLYQKALGQVAADAAMGTKVTASDRMSPPPPLLTVAFSNPIPINAQCYFEITGLAKTPTVTIVNATYSHQMHFAFSASATGTAGGWSGVRDDPDGFTFASSYAQPKRGEIRPMCTVNGVPLPYPPVGLPGALTR